MPDLAPATIASDHQIKRCPLFILRHLFLLFDPLPIITSVAAHPTIVILLSDNLGFYRMIVVARHAKRLALLKVDVRNLRVEASIDFFRKRFDEALVQNRSGDRVDALRYRLKRGYWPSERTHLIIHRIIYLTLLPSIDGMYHPPLHRDRFSKELLG